MADADPGGRAVGGAAVDREARSTRSGAPTRTTTWAPTTCPRTSSPSCSASTPTGSPRRSIRGGGLRIYTSLNYDLQRAAWQAVTSTLHNEDDPNTPEWEGDPEAAMVAVDDQGLVRAMVGSRHRVRRRGTYEANYAVRGNGSDGLPARVDVQAARAGRGPARGLLAELPLRRPGPHGVRASGQTDGEPVEGQQLLRERRRRHGPDPRPRPQSSNTAYAQLMLDLGTDIVDPDGDGAPDAPEGPDNVAALAERMGVGGRAASPSDQTHARHGAGHGQRHAARDGGRVLDVRQPRRLHAGPTSSPASSRSTRTARPRSSTSARSRRTGS